MNFHGKRARYLFARFDRYQFAHLIISRDSRVSSPPILIKSHTRHGGNTFATLSDFKDRYFPTPYEYVRAPGMRRGRVCVSARVHERWLACRRTSRRHPHERAELIMHSLFYQYPEYRVRHVPRIGLEGGSQPRRSSARRYPPPPPPFATVIPRLTDGGRRGGTGEERERERKGDVQEG